MHYRLFTLVLVGIFLWSGASATRILIPMDSRSQANHLKAYGIAFAALKEGIKVDWLLNYKGGSFGIESDKDLQYMCKERGVTYFKLSNKQYDAILKEVNAPAFNGKVVKLEKAPKIAVYTPLNKKPWDDAVTLALTYAEIPFDKIYVDEVLAGDLSKYDWLHLHHEDFTGQYGKFWATYGNTDWYKQDKAGMEALAARHGFKKVSQMQLAVVKKIREFVADGGNMFAMCSATQTLDIALAAENTDICPAPFDGDGTDPDMQSKLDFTNCFAFKDFKVSGNSYDPSFSNIDNNNATRARRIAGTSVMMDNSTMTPVANDMFTLYDAQAKFDPVSAMLTQDHQRMVQGFMGQTTAFRKEVLKPGVEVLGDFATCDEARYIHGELGKGSWTFLGGHDPEDYQHLVGSSPTDLDMHPNSPGYRLILNNVLVPAAEKTIMPTVVINATPTPETTPKPAARPGGIGDVTKSGSVKIFPNPADDDLVITVSPGSIEQVIIQNFAGQEVINQSFHADKVSVSLANLPAGMYLVKVNGEFAGKVVKE